MRARNRARKGPVDTYDLRISAERQHITASMRRVRWAAVVFVLFQFAFYVPPDHLVVPFPLLLTGGLVAGVIASVNALSLLMVRIRPSALPAWGLVEIGADVAIVLAVVWAFSFDVQSALWALLVLPVLEGALRFGMRGALATWVVVSLGYAARDAWAAAVITGREFVPVSISYRMGIVFIVALTAGSLASHLRVQTAAHRHARREAEHRANQLQTVAGAARRLTRPDVCLAASVVTDAATMIGFDTAAVWILGERGEVERLAAWSGGRPRQGRRWGQAIADRIATSPSTLIEPDIAPGCGWDGAQLVAACPVWAGGDVVAVLAAARRAPGPVSPVELECLQLLATQAGAAINNAKRFAERITHEEQLQHLAFHDFLTGLPNRVLFQSRLEQALERARQRGTLIAMLFLDLDGFKTMNDSLGHEAGDELLRAVAERLQGMLGPGELVARFGGDEFTVLLTGLLAQEDAVLLAERIHRSLAEPFAVRGRELYISVSIGIAFGPQGRLLPGEVVRDADLAMYSAKQQGRGGIAVFTPDLSVRALRQLEVETDLRRAIDRGELELVFQPVMSIQGRRLASVEALVRWRHPQLGMILPHDFIPVAEETGLIVPLGRWALREACVQAQHWRRRHDADGLMLGVNLSGRQLQDPHLVDEIADVLRETGFPADRLILEITESVMMRDVEATVRQVMAIDRLGVRLAVDDFGQGYSSLSRLKGMPFHLLKIDKSFVDGLAHNPADRAIVHSVITLAHDLGIAVTAEGVETGPQLQVLQTLGCDLAQGFYICEPLDTDEVALLLASYRSMVLESRPAREERATTALRAAAT